MCMQMEFIHLSRLTGEPKYGAAAERVIKFLNAKFDQARTPLCSLHACLHPSILQYPCSQSRS